MPIRRLGGLTDAETYQLSFFEDEECARSLEKATESIKERYGNAAIIRASSLTHAGQPLERSMNFVESYPRISNTAGAYLSSDNCASKRKKSHIRANRLMYDRIIFEHTIIYLSFIKATKTMCYRYLFSFPSYASVSISD